MWCRPPKIAAWLLLLWREEPHMVVDPSLHLGEGGLVCWVMSLPGSPSPLSSSLCSESQGSCAADCSDLTSSHVASKGGVTHSSSPTRQGCPLLASFPPILSFFRMLRATWIHWKAATGLEGLAGLLKCSYFEAFKLLHRRVSWALEVEVVYGHLLIIKYINCNCVCVCFLLI